MYRCRKWHVPRTSFGNDPGRQLRSRASISKPGNFISHLKQYWRGLNSFPAFTLSRPYLTQWKRHPFWGKLEQLYNKFDCFIGSMGQWKWWGKKLRWLMTTPLFDAVTEKICFYLPIPWLFHVKGARSILLINSTLPIAVSAEYASIQSDQTWRTLRMMKGFHILLPKVCLTKFWSRDANACGSHSKYFTITPQLYLKWSAYSYVSSKSKSLLFISKMGRNEKLGIEYSSRITPHKHWKSLRQKPW